MSEAAVETTQTSEQDVAPKKKKTRSMGTLVLARVGQDTDGSTVYTVAENLPEFDQVKDVENYIRENDFDGETVSILRIARTVKIEQEVARKTSFADVD